MALTWEALATRDPRMLAAGARAPARAAAGYAWVNYVRSHDDIGWTFADEDAAELGIDGFDHRRFLNDFYVGPVPGQFARGVPFQENPQTGDARIAGTTASLAGVEAGDAGRRRPRRCSPTPSRSRRAASRCSTSATRSPSSTTTAYRDDPAMAGDSRWVHRPRYPAAGTRSATTRDAGGRRVRAD